jgi:hypothetical protein
LKIVAFIAESHYLLGAMVFFTIVALVIGIIRYNRHRHLRIFTWYIAFSLLQDLTACYALAYWHPGSFPWRVMNGITLAFSLFEFFVCNLFILHYITSPLRRRVIRISGLLYLVLLVVVAAITYPRYSDQYYIIPEALFLVIPCLIYFYELFLTKNLRPLTDQPAFWVVTGVLFLNACDIPLLITVRILAERRYYFRDARSLFNDVYSLNYVLYSILFALLIRAFLCPPESQARVNYLT